MKIIRNSIRCVPCDEEIESTHRHDFRWCKGKHVAVDGGRAYLRRAYSEDAEFVETSIEVPE